MTQLAYDKATEKSTITILILDQLTLHQRLENAADW